MQFLLAADLGRCHHILDPLAQLRSGRAPSQRTPPVRRSGSGGAGEIIRDAKRRTVPNFKYRPGGNVPKTITLPLGEPSPGTDGAHVVLFVDPHVDTLLHLHHIGRKVLSHRNARSHAAPSGVAL